MTTDVFATADGVHHHLDADDQPRVTLPRARYEELLAIESAAAGTATPMIERLRAIAAAAEVHVDTCAQLGAADAHHAGKHATLAARAAAMAALLIARGGVVASSAGLCEAVKMVAAAEGGG